MIKKLEDYAGTGFYIFNDIQKISKKVKIFGFKDSDLGQFNLANIELLIKKNSTIAKNILSDFIINNSRKTNN